MADVLRRTIRASMDLTRNEADMYSQEYYKADQAVTLHTHQRLVLATSSGQQQLDLGGMSASSPAATLMICTDRAIVVAVDSAANTLDLSMNGMLLMTGSFTHVYVQNNSTTYTASIEFVATD